MPIMTEDLQQRLGYQFRDLALLRLAMTHPSAMNEQKLDDDNQRLEFLGDAALGLAAAEHGYLQHTGLPEGKLTSMRSAAANAAALAAIAREVNIGHHLILGVGEESSGGRDKDKNLADALEAVMGAAYLDGGMDAVRAIFKSLFTGRLDSYVSSGGDDNPKGTLQEWAQQHGLPCPAYRVLNEEGPAHEKFFTIEAQIGEGERVTGTGKSKRSAESEAARRLLTFLMR
jgi:ribonuclease-3